MRIPLLRPQNKKKDLHGQETFNDVYVVNQPVEDGSLVGPSVQIDVYLYADAGVNGHRLIVVVGTIHVVVVLSWLGVVLTTTVSETLFKLKEF